MGAVAYEFSTTILPGHRIEVSAPELPEGCEAKVVVIVTDAVPKRRVSEILADYKGPFSFKSAEEVDAYIREERDSWGD